MSSSSDEHTSVPSDSRKGAWTAKEDQCLQARVAKYGTKSWTTIASGVEGRSAKSCRLRWYNQLCPGVKRTPFSEWEQAVIIKAQKVHTNKWAALAKLLKGRTDNAIKNHWNATLSRKLNNPAENFRNQYIERNVTLEWLLQHPELDSSNDIEEALAGTFGSSKASKLGLGVTKPLKKKKRRSTPSSPSYSLSPSPPPPCRSSKSQRQAAALEACCESGLSSETAPAASKRAAVAAAAAAAANAAAAAGGGGGCSYNLNQQYGAAVAGGQQHSGCYSPCSQTRSPPAMHAQQQQQQLSMHCTGCMPGPGGMCSCGVWMGPPQQQQQQQYHSSNAALERTTTASSYLSCQDGQLSNMLWEQPPQQQPQQRGGDFGSSYGAPQDFHGSNFQALPVQQQQQQQQMFLKPEPQFSSPMQDAIMHSPVKQEPQQSLLLPPEQQQQQQQHSSSSMSSGSPVGVAAGVPDRSHSSTDLPAAAAGGSAAAASGLRIQTDAAVNACSSLLAGLPPAASSRTSVTISAAAAAAGAPDAQGGSLLQAGGGPASHGAWKPNCNLAGGMHLPPSDCLGPLGIRPLGQGKILSPAAYDMMVAGVSRPGMEVQLRSENGAVHAAAAAAAGEMSQGASLQQHHSVPPPSMMSAVPAMMGSGNGSSRGLSPHHPLGRSHSYSCGPSHYDGSSNSFNPAPGLPHFSSSGGCYPGSEFGPNGPGSSSSRGGPGGFSHHMGVQGSSYGPEPSGPYSSSGLGSFLNCSMGPEAAAYAASNAACARAGSGRNNLDLPPVSRCHSTPSPYNAGGGSSGGGYPPAPWQQQQQLGLPPRSSYPISAGGSYEANMCGLPPAGSHMRHHSYGGAHNPAAAAPYGSSSNADPLLNMPASLLADAPATVMLQQAVASGAAAAAAAGGSSSDLHMGLLKDMSAAGPHVHFQQQQQHLVHAHTAPALSSLGGPADHLQQQQRAGTPPPTAWDAVGETLSTAFGDAGDDSLVWDNFDLPDLKENDVEALLML